ncbi:AAA family ATPase [Actinomadura flavalba]|uniref:AAA family ATPase n=1 Tax=Actinomadura flavalba TaxID=1120938 RepID=UPI000371DD0E|nr:SMC family ATPase [Actinomadura flavalba]
MRLHRLEVTAFGPFSGTETIDFDTLSDAGLFLIRGRTGAGKTSVLDAVCFALYGQVPGVRNAAKGLHSDHAAPGTGPSVRLETTIRGRRLRVMRAPAWERPKLRGTGTTTEKAKVILEEYEHGAWTALATRNDEAGDVILSLLGMNAAQFCQVALLPQGEFAGFLRAGAEERRKVLEKLFAAEVFTQVEKWLAERRAATGRAVDALEASAASVADRVAETAGTVSPLAPRGPVPGPRAAEPALVPGVEVLPGWAAGLAADLDAARDAVTALAEGARAGLAQARASVDEARALADLQARHAAATARRDALAARLDERSELGSRLDAAARADRVLPYLHAVTDRGRRLTQARRSADDTRARVAALLPPGAADDVLGKAERDRRDELAQLDTRRADAHRLTELARERTALDGELTRLTAEEQRAGAALTELPARVESRRTALAAAREAAAAEPGARRAAEDATRRLTSARRRDALIPELTTAEDAHRAATDAAQTARDHVLTLRQSRLDGMAEVLAARLVPGEPCTVCGSPDHPAPATHHTTQISATEDPRTPHPAPDRTDPTRTPSTEAAQSADGRVRAAWMPGAGDVEAAEPVAGRVPEVEEIEAAQTAADRAQSAREVAGGVVERTRAELAALREVVGDVAVGEVEAEVRAARQALAEAERQGAEAAGLAAALRDDEEALDAARERRDALARTLAERRTRVEHLAAEHDRLRAELAEARGDDPSLEARAERLRREADALRAAADAARDAIVAGRELAAARATAAETVAAEGFASGDAAHAAALDDEEQGVLRDKERRYDVEKGNVERELAEPALTRAAARPAPDVPALDAALAAAEAVHTAAASAADRARVRCARLAELRAELAAAVARWRPAADEHAVARRLAGLASGTDTANRRAMSLSAYVLAARLEQVVAAANERLGRMSSGRYVLEHTVEKAAGDRTRSGGGLGLRVADAWTGRVREPATLSGGESFITSLALALGLADVVTTEAGGTEIGTLFVDEGFGTLDEDTLDEVMDVLDGLRDGGRAVGIVSHVAELRARVPTQLHITKERHGSTTKINA